MSFRHAFLRRFGGLVLVLLAVCPAGRPQPWPGAPSRFTLKNGLEVVLSEDPSLPLVSVAVSYRVGSADDPPGKAGLAYLMETLMFSGSANVPPSQHINTLYRIGGVFNAAATADRTTFFQTVPSHYLALVLWLESDRMRSLEITTEAFERARNDHQGEVRRKRLEQAYSEAELVFDQAVYPDQALSHSMAGTESSLESLTAEDARAFYSEFYVPNRAILSIAGQFDRVRTRDLIARYFETIPRGKDVPRVAPAPSVPPKKIAARDIMDGLASSPAFFLGYRLGAAGSSDRYALGLLDFLLFKGPTSRLNRRLLNKNNKIAFEVSGGIEVRGDSASYRIFVIANTAGMLEVCLNATAAEIERLRKTFLSEEELNRVKRIFQAEYLDRFSTPTSRAFALAAAFFVRPDFSSSAVELERYMAVTPYDIRVVASRYFSAENAIVVTVRVQ